MLLVLVAVSHCDYDEYMQSYTTDAVGAWSERGMWTAASMLADRSGYMFIYKIRVVNPRPILLVLEYLGEPLVLPGLVYVQGRLDARNMVQAGAR